MCWRVHLRVLACSPECVGVLTGMSVGVFTGVSVLACSPECVGVFTDVSVLACSPA